MDTRSNEFIRKDLLEKGNLLSVLRLPNNTFNGTQVVSDIILYQRDYNKKELNENDLKIVSSYYNFQHEGKSVEINSYFNDNPASLFGTPYIKGLYGNNFDLKANEGQDTALLIKENLSNINIEKALVLNKPINYTQQRRKASKTVSDSIQLS